MSCATVRNGRKVSQSEVKTWVWYPSEWGTCHLCWVEKWRKENILFVWSRCHTHHRGWHPSNLFRAQHFTTNVQRSADSTNAQLGSENVFLPSPRGSSSKSYSPPRQRTAVASNRSEHSNMRKTSLNRYCSPPNDHIDGLCFFQWSHMLHQLSTATGRWQSHWKRPLGWRNSRSHYRFPGAIFCIPKKDMFYWVLFE